MPELDPENKFGRLVRIADSALFVFLCSVIVLAPALYGSTDTPIRLVLEMSVFIALAVFSVISIPGKTNPRFHPLFLPVLVFALYLLIQILPIVPGQEFGGVQWRTLSINPPLTLTALIEFISLCGCAYLTFALVNTKKRLIILVNVIV